MAKATWTRRKFLIVAGAAGVATFYWANSAKVKDLSCYSQTVLAKRPLAYWRLGESQGPTAFDATQNGHHGLFYGSPTYGEGGAISHDPNSAIKLDGSGAYTEVPNSQMFSQPTSGQGLTVEVWMRPDRLTFAGEAEGYVHWLGKGEPGQQEWALRFYSKDTSRPNRVSAYIWNLEGGLGAGAYFQDNLEPSAWIHVVACYDPGDLANPEAGVSIYKNGVLRGGPTTSPGALYQTYQIKPTHGTAPLRLGTRDLVSFWGGGLDEIAIYPRVLTADEILENYQRAIAPCPVPSPSPTSTVLSTETPTAQSTPIATATPTRSATPIATPITPPQPTFQVQIPLIQR